jgi:MFS family permease
MLASSQALALWHLYVLFFLAGFLGAGSLFAPLVANAGNWFKTGVGLAIGIVSAGQALGQGGVPFVSAFLISAFGWRGAFASLGVDCPHDPYFAFNVYSKGTRHPRGQKPVKSLGSG